LIDSLLFGAFALVTVPTLAAAQTTSDAVGLVIPYATNYGIGEFNGSGVSTRVLVRQIVPIDSTQPPLSRRFTGGK